MAGARRLAGRGRAAAVAETRGVLYVRQKQWAATRPGERLEDGQVRHQYNHSEALLYKYKIP